MDGKQLTKSNNEIRSDTRSVGQRRSRRSLFRHDPPSTWPVGQMRQGFASFPIRARYQIIYLVRSLFPLPNRTLCRSLRNLQTQRMEVKRPTIKRLVIAAAIISLILIHAYLETTLGFTPNH